MTTRQHVVDLALPDNGLYDGVGYPGPSNKFDIALGRPNEYSCDDGVTYWFWHAGVPLPLMQTGMQGVQSGSSYTPSGVNYARAHGAAINSWESLPADIWFFDWNSNGQADHVELFIKWLEPDLALTLGADSGPSNYDSFRGEGGVHLHTWKCPKGVGNPLVVQAVDASKLVTFTEDAPVKPPPVPSSPDKQTFKTQPKDTFNSLSQLLNDNHNKADQLWYDNPGLVEAQPSSGKRLPRYKYDTYLAPGQTVHVKFSSKIVSR